LKFFPKTAVVLNIEEEHLDCYKDLDDIKNAFNSFLDIPSEDGTIILNADDVDCMAIAQNHKANLITFGIDNPATWIATNIVKNEDSTYSFTAKSASDEINVKLSVFGYHNIYNALAAIAVSKTYNLSNEAIIEGLLAFGGAKRRFEYVGMYNEIKIYDDYAHHPTEIKATLKTAKTIAKQKIWVVFQPHTYSRTHTLFDKFVTAFEDADEVIVLDIYAAREKDTGLVSSSQLAAKINEHSNNAIHISTIPEATEYLKEKMNSGDILLTIGAGNVTHLGRNLGK
jgi:UDP-N-acetylmuramate--alanine ligase